MEMPTITYILTANYTEDKKPKFRSDRYQFTVVIPNLNYGVDEQIVEFISDMEKIVALMTLKLALICRKI